MAHTTQQLWAAVEPVKRKHFGLGLKKGKQLFAKIAKVSTGAESVRHAVEYGGSGQLVRKTEGGSVTPLTIRQGTNKTWLYDLYAGEITLTYELARDSKVREIQRASETLGRSVACTPDYIFAQFLGRAFNSSYPATADGKEMCATDHLIIGTNSSDGSNELATPAALSETSMEDVYTALMTMLGADGMISSIMPEKLIVPAALAHTAKKLTKSGKTLGTANNDPKVVGDGLEVVVNPYLDTHSTSRWFVLTDWDLGGIFWEWDVKSESLEDQNIHTLNRTSMTFFRARHGCDDWRHVFGIAAS
jgi:phage major head subunit gpT-like protein